MNRDTSPDAGLDPALHALRDSLAAVELPPGREEELRAAFRRRHVEAGARSEPARFSSSRRRRRPARVYTAAAAAVAVLAVAVAALFAGNAIRSGDPGPMAAVLAESQDASRGGGDTTALAANGFQPLLSGPAYTPSASYSIVRVRVPLSALSPGSPSAATIEADLLVGEDGLASGIRFNAADTVFVSTSTH